MDISPLSPVCFANEERYLLIAGREGGKRKTLKRLLSLLLFISFALVIFRDVQAGQREANGHLNRVMDQFHQSFDVFTDLTAAGNHFAARCAMAANDNFAGVAFDEGWTQNCHSGATCIKNAFSAIDSTYWGGWYFQNGVLHAGDTQPRCNWGDYPGAGFDLTGATKITFWARGEKGKEEIEFFAGGVGRDPFTGEPVKPYPDSFRRVPPVGTVTMLTKEWKKYTIDLTDLNLGYVVGGFGWVANATNNPSGATFYLDDIQYDKARPNDLGFLVSYKTLPVRPKCIHEIDFDTVFKNVAFTYDNVMVLLAYLASGSYEGLRRATLLADAFVYAQNHDRYYEDGRLRNAYQGGDLILPPGWTPNDRKGTARMPGWWDLCEKKWYEDAEQVGTYTGNMAWVLTGFLRAYQVLGKTEYLDAAKRLGLWIEENTRDARGTGGYTGGFEGWEPTPAPLLWKSTEHNIDLYVAFMTLSDLTPEPGKSLWRERALHAKKFVRSMWEACGAHHFATGTKDNGVTPNCDFAPGDVNTWGVMALGELATYGVGIDWVQTNCQVSEPCFKGRLGTGIDFNEDQDGIWWEGTAHTVIAKRIKKENREAKFLLKNLRMAQRFAPNTNRTGIVATCHDGVTTGIQNFLLFNRLHVAATAWYVLAERRHNPFWGIKTSDPIPHERE